jgi:hypothetical protein
MIGLLCFVLAILASPFKSKLRLEAENAVLRHQLIVLKRTLHGLSSSKQIELVLYLSFKLVRLPKNTRDTGYMRTTVGGSLLFLLN